MNKKDRPYRVVPYDPSWVERYKQEEKILKEIFGNKAERIEHIGSTSVKDMWAKPQIDIIVIVENLNIAEDLKPELEQAGYIHLPEYDQYDKRYFYKDADTGERLVSVHVLTPKHPQAKSHLYFRDYLRQHKQARDEYSAVKRKAFEAGADRETYSEQKKKVLESIKQQARDWYKQRAT